MSRGFMIAALVAFLAPVLGALAYLSGSEEGANAALPARTLLPQAERKLSGTTSQKRNFGIKLSRDGSKIVLLTVSYEASCLNDSMKMALDDKLFTPIKVARDGRFTVQNLGQRISITGRIANGKATGNFRIAMVYGGLLGCKTKPITFSARS